MQFEEKKSSFGEYYYKNIFTGETQWGSKNFFDTEIPLPKGFVGLILNGKKIYKYIGDREKKSLIASYSYSPRATASFSESDWPPLTRKKDSESEKDSESDWPPLIRKKDSESEKVSESDWPPLTRKKDSESEKDKKVSKLEWTSLIRKKDSESEKDDTIPPGFQFSFLPSNVILKILTELFNDKTDTLQSNIANIGSVRIINTAIQADSSKVNIVDFMDTRIWLRLLISTGIFYNLGKQNKEWNDTIRHYLGQNGSELVHKEWDDTIRNYLYRIVRELRYTSRVHDLIDLYKRDLSLIIRNYAKILLDKLIKTDSSTLEKKFLAGNMTDIPRLNNATIVEFVRSGKKTDIIRYWDVRNVTDMHKLFKDHRFSFDLTYWDTKNVTNMSECMSITKMNGITNWNTCRVRDMSYCFDYATRFNQPLEWNTSNVTDMSGMFSNATSFNQLLHWDTSNVKDMTAMFSGAESFNQPLRWNTGNVENMMGMFTEATSFNQPLEWNTIHVINMEEMFSGATAFNQPLKWNTYNVINMGGMFAHNTTFNKPLDLKTDNVKDMSNMFTCATSFNQPLVWETKNVESMFAMFTEATSFNQQLHWDTRKVTNMRHMFDDATSFNQELDWDKVKTTVDISYMFRNSHGRFKNI
jgi:hypothetical protein